MRRTGYLGLGSNLGKRRAHLQAAILELQLREVDVLASSSTYDTEPVGEILDQPSFLNACARVQTELGPEELLDVCKAVERAVGREAGAPRHAPRVIDVDLLLLGDVNYRSERLQVPHTEVLLRRFVLVPLLDLDPDLALTGGKRAADALTAIGPANGVRLAGRPLSTRKPRADVSD